MHKVVIIILCIFFSGCSIRWYFLDPKSSTELAWSHYFHAISLELEEEWEEATVHFRATLRYDKLHPEPYVHLAKCLAHLEKKQKALEALQNAEQLPDWDNNFLHKEAGDVYKMLDDLENAQRHYSLYQ